LAGRRLWLRPPGAKQREELGVLRSHATKRDLSIKPPSLRRHKKFTYWGNERVGRSSPVSRLGIRGSDFTLVVKILASRRSCVQPVHIPAVVDLTQIVKIPERQRIKVLDLRIALERQGKHILDRV